MDYFRVIFYFGALYGHMRNVWWAMPFAIIMNGLIDDLDGKVARAFDQCSKFGYIIDCASDNLAVVTNTGCIAHAALRSSVLSPWLQWSIVGVMHSYCFFFMFWSALASVCMGLLPNYKAFHKTPWAKWYYNTVAGDAILYLGMQLWWAVLYLAVQGTYADTAFCVCSVLTPLTIVKVSIEVENVVLMTLGLKDADAQAALATGNKES